MSKFLTPFSTILLIALWFCTCATVKAQQDGSNQSPNRHTVFIEALGYGLFGSVNYEYQITKNPGLSVRAGIGFYTEYDFYLTLPLTVHYLIPLKKRNFIETGIGYTYADVGGDSPFSSNDDGADDLHNLMASIGFLRYFGNSWMWKASFTPIITNNKDVTFPWQGIAIGKRF